MQLVHPQPRPLAAHHPPLLQTRDRMQWDARGPPPLLVKIAPDLTEEDMKGGWVGGWECSWPPAASGQQHVALRHIAHAPRPLPRACRYCGGGAAPEGGRSHRQQHHHHAARRHCGAPSGQGGAPQQPERGRRRRGGAGGEEAQPEGVQAERGCTRTGLQAGARLTGQKPCTCCVEQQEGVCTSAWACWACCPAHMPAPPKPALRFTY